jgi:phosphatidylinositol glycan class B
MAHAVGVNDPFVLTFLLRLLTVMLAFWSIPAFVRSTLHLIGPQLHRPYMLLSFFLWFLPFLNVRFTGETWSGLLFLLGLASLLSPKGKVSRYWHTGIFFGLAFLCRPPVLMMIAGAALWLAIIHKERPRNLFHLVIGMLSMMLSGIALDSWFYGSFSLTAWNYARMGMVGGGHHPFTSFPWWYYFAWTFKYAIPVFGIPILLAFGTMLVLRPKSIIVWVTLPFLLLHVLLPHKELRFFWPLAELAPWMLVLAAGACIARWPGRTEALLQRSVMVPIGIFLMAINVVALSVVALTPAGSGSTRLAALIRDRWPGEAVHLNYLADERTVWEIRLPSFYLPPGSTDTLASTPCVPFPADAQPVELLVARGAVPLCASNMDGTWQEVSSALPLWSELLMRMYAWEDARPAWKLYEAVPLAAVRAE